MIVSKLNAHWEDDRVRIEAEIDRLLSSEVATSDNRVLSAMRYAIAGGKRIRPILAIRIARLFQNRSSLTLRIATAIEFVHCASLVIDDLPSMDNSPLRRGRPTTHLAFGEATAILAAFGLLVLAGRSILERPHNSDELPVLVAFQQLLFRALDCNGLIAGQARDLLLSVKPRIEDRAAADLKTIPLFTLAIHAGSMFAGVHKEQMEQAMKFGREFGRAYQMIDDLVDGQWLDVSVVVEQIRVVDECREHLNDINGQLKTLIEYLDARVANHLMMERSNPSR